MFIAAVLVLFMQAGFAMLEVGLNAAKNTVNILFKNVMDLSVGVILFQPVSSASAVLSLRFTYASPRESVWPAISRRASQLRATLASMPSTR